MIASRVFAAVDSHTEGMPTRVITGGVGPIPGATMLERKLHFEQNLDHLRLLLMREPRGHGAMSGAILQPPLREDADWGILFIEVSGCLPMCGHGTIGVATVLVETGMVEVSEPETLVRLDTPAGLVEARVAVEGGRARSVALRNVPSFLLARDRTVTVNGHGLTYDMAFGGNFYALVAAESAGVAVDPGKADDLISRGQEIMAAINAADRPVHPGDDRIAGCRHVVFTAARWRRAALAAQRHLHPPGLARPLALRYRHLGEAGRAPRPGRAEPRRGVRQRVGDRHPVPRPDRRRDRGGGPAGDRSRDQGAGLDHRHGPVRARPRGPVPGGLRPLNDRPFEVAVVGAGIVGCAAAWELARRGVRVGSGRPGRGLGRQHRAGRGQRALL